MIQDIRVRRFDIGRVITAGWGVFWKDIGNILPVLLAVYVPINIVLAIFNVDRMLEEGGAGGFVVYIYIMQLSEALIGVIATMALAELIESKIMGGPVTWKQALRQAFSSWGHYLITALLAGLIIIGLSLLLIVPGIIWSLYYTFVAYVVVLRGISGKEALDYSKGIVKGQWWRVFGYMLVIMLLGMGAMFLADIPFMFMPKIHYINVISGTISDVIFGISICMIIVFFLNNDYLKSDGSEDLSPDAEQGTGIQ